VTDSHHARIKLGLAGACLLLGLSLAADEAQSTRVDGPRFVPAEEVDAQGPSTAHVAIEQFQYSPYQIKVSPQTTVLWTNRDGVDHDVTFRDGDVKSPLVGKDGKIAAEFTEPGEYAYYCHVHPFMQGTVVVE